MESDKVNEENNKDLVAPGVNITAPTPGGASTTVPGTSFSTPFVTGSAALLMEWGLIQRNDPFLWGEKVKAYLRRGAQPLPGFNEYPNEDFLSPGSVPFILGSIYMHNTPDAAESNK